MVRKRRTNNKRTRMVKSRKMARRRTKKRKYSKRKKKMKGGSLNLSEGALEAHQKQQLPLSAPRSSRSILKQKMNPPEMEKQQPQMYLEDIRGIMEENEGGNEDSPQERKTPVMLSFAPHSNFTRYDGDRDLCENHTEEDSCNEQSGCNWIEDKCLPSSEVMSTGEPTKGKPLQQYLTDEEKKILEESQLLNEILLASFGYDKKGNIIAKKLVLNAEELSKLIYKDEAEVVIQKINDKDSDMATMVKNNKKYIFPNTGREGQAGAIKRQMDTLKRTLEEAIKKNILCPRPTGREACPAAVGLEEAIKKNIIKDEEDEEGGL